MHDLDGRDRVNLARAIGAIDAVVLAAPNRSVRHASASEVVVWVELVNFAFCNFCSTGFLTCHQTIILKDNVAVTVVVGGIVEFVVEVSIITITAAGHAWSAVALEFAIASVAPAIVWVAIAPFASAAPVARIWIAPTNFFWGLER